MSNLTSNKNLLVIFLQPFFTVLYVTRSNHSCCIIILSTHSGNCVWIHLSSCSFHSLSCTLLSMHTTFLSSHFRNMTLFLYETRTSTFFSVQFITTFSSPFLLDLTVPTASIWSRFGTLKSSGLLQKLSKSIIQPWVRSCWAEVNTVSDGLE
jgi:hypothetical protein